MPSVVKMWLKAILDCWKIMAIIILKQEWVQGRSMDNYEASNYADAFGNPPEEFQTRNTFPIRNNQNNDLQLQKELSDFKLYPYTKLSSFQNSRGMLNNMRHIERNYAEYQRRTSFVPTKRPILLPELDYAMKTTIEKGTDGKQNDKNDVEVQRQMDELKKQIVNTTLEIDKLYRSLMSNGTATSVTIDPKAQSNVTSIATGKVRAICAQGSKKCCGEEEIRRLKENTRIEKEVRNEMIRFLAKAKMENNRITKALQAVLKYYHPNETVMNKLGISASLKRVILAERIKMLPKRKRMELAKRFYLLRRKQGSGV